MILLFGFELPLFALCISNDKSLAKFFFSLSRPRANKFDDDDDEKSVPKVFPSLLYDV